MINVIKHVLLSDYCQHIYKVALDLINGH